MYTSKYSRHLIYHIPKAIFKDYVQCGYFVSAACEAARKAVEENDHNSIFSFGYPIEDLDLVGRGAEYITVHESATAAEILKLGVDMQADFHQDFCGSDTYVLLCHDFMGICNNAAKTTTDGTEHDGGVETSGTNVSQLHSNSK